MVGSTGPLSTPTRLADGLGLKDRPCADRRIHPTWEVPRSEPRLGFSDLAANTSPALPKGFSGLAPVCTSRTDPLRPATSPEQAASRLLALCAPSLLGRSAGGVFCHAGVRAEVLPRGRAPVPSMGPARSDAPRSRHPGFARRVRLVSAPRPARPLDVVRPRICERLRAAGHRLRLALALRCGRGLVGGGQCGMASTLRSPCDDRPRCARRATSGDTLLFL